MEVPMLRQPVTDPVVRALVTTVTTPRERPVDDGRASRVVTVFEHGMRISAIAIYLSAIAVFGWLALTLVG